MGDGGVACMPLQNIMEKLPIADKTLCGGNSSNNSNANGNGVASKPTKPPDARPKKKRIVKVVKRVIVKKGEKRKQQQQEAQEPQQKQLQEQKEHQEEQKQQQNQLRKQEKPELESHKAEKSSGRVVDNGDHSQKEEVEEGELGTLKWPREVENGEIVSDRLCRSEIEKGEIVGEISKKGQAEKGEIAGEKSRKGEAGKVENVGEKSRKEEIEKGVIITSKGPKVYADKRDVVPDKSRKGEIEKREFRTWRDPRDEIEKGEFIPDRWRKGDTVKDDYGYSRSRRYEFDRDKSWKYDREFTPPSGRYSNDDIYRRKDLSRSGGQHARSYSSRWELGQERNLRINSKIVDEDGSCKSDGHGREFSSSCNRLKRHGTESDGSDRKYYYGDYGDYACSKSRRLSDDNCRSLPDHYSRGSVERFHRDSSSSKLSSLDKYSSRHREPSLPSRVVYDRHGHSPGRPAERSPRDRTRYHDHRDRSPLRHERSPYSRDRSPHGREGSPFYRERSPHARKRSPYDRTRRHDRRSPSYSEWSPKDRTRANDRRDRTPNYLERSPLDRSRQNNCKETGRRSGESEKRSSQSCNKEQEDKTTQKDSSVKDSRLTSKVSQERSSVHNSNELVKKSVVCDPPKEEKCQSPDMNGKESVQVDGPLPEELLSMEEDMDICDTPPHVPAVADSSAGKWFYLDYYGVEHGPSKLHELKALMEQGVLLSDHMIKHSDCNRWITVEKAASPMVSLNFPSIVSDAVTQLVSPPEAPGNLLADATDTVYHDIQIDEGAQVSLVQPFHLSDADGAGMDPSHDHHIDKRVGALLDGYTIIPGRELESLGEALQIKVEHGENWGFEASEDFTWHVPHLTDQNGQTDLEFSRHPKVKSGESAEVVLDKDYGSASDDAGGWWSCKGGDWIRSDEAAHDKPYRKRVVLNDGFPLCQMPKSGYEDPRSCDKDDLYLPSSSRKLDIPLWAFSSLDDLSQNKSPVTRGVKGTMLPVVRINACVVKEHGSFVPDPSLKVRRERHSSRPARPPSATSDSKRALAKNYSQSKYAIDQDVQSSSKISASISTPKDRLCTVNDLQLHLGEWFYLDGTGHERGPLSFLHLQVLVEKGIIQNHTSVFRKFDKLWVPVTPSSVAIAKIGRENYSLSSRNPTNSSSFHSLHPQFIGYTRGKLHELVMKTYKSREFAAAINEVLDPWISARQPKKEIDKNAYQTSEGDVHYSKRGRMLADGIEEDSDMEGEGKMHRMGELTFEDLCSNSTFPVKEHAHPGMEVVGWGPLDGLALARVFHFLRSDLKSLVFASLTCKHWRAAVRFYKDISRQVDLSSLGSTCTDSIVWSIMNNYNKGRINSMILVGCTNVTSYALEGILRLFPSISAVDIRGCSQFGELEVSFPNVRWFKGQRSQDTKISGDNSKIRSLKQVTDIAKSKGLESDMDDFGNLKDYFESVEKRDSANQLFRRSLYKRSKLFDARKSSSILSRDARIRRWAIKKSEYGYKRVEEFLASSLKDIMKHNTFDFFVPKVAKIEERMKFGHYIKHGLTSVKEDISRMCREAIKVKNRGGAGDMNHIVELFIQLAIRLEQVSKVTSSYEREELMKSWQDDSQVVAYSSNSKYKKKLSKVATEKKHMRSNGASSLISGLDYGEYASDREIRKRLSKLNHKSFDSGSETSSDADQSSEDGRSNKEGEGSSSNTESDSDFRSENWSGKVRGDGYFTNDESFDSAAEEREWGARMTKASLVPPVTRKYEVVDKYVIVADEEDVQRKMRVSLPDDYSEKLNAQKSGTEELDMELPEVKDYKPRKLLGWEVIEQEVYGIDPYTHNLLLDSMPEELEWSLLDKHSFIEDVVLCTLNKQVRHFTGTGNTPMMYPLKPVIEGIKETAEEECDIRTMRMCQGILMAMDRRPDDKYVAYRKGLGVVCNRETGFGDDDFVVEFLGEVYPVWKWFEKQDGIRSLQENKTDPAPEFYNIYLERPKGDADGYDLVVVDAMHKANYASRICHSCRPNCEAKVTAVDGQYQIGIYSVRKIQYGEEITFDYNSVTESKEEYEASVCLCGSQVCRGSYLNLTGEGAFQKVLKEWHGLLDRHQLMLEACELNMVSEEDYLELGRAGLGSCLLGGLPDWVVAYSARLVRFINLERTKLPEQILKHNLEEKRKYFSEICLDVEKSDAEVQAEGVYNQRLQNLAVTLDKVRYVMRCVFGDAKKAPPPLERLSPEEVVSFLWKGEGSIVEELLQNMSPHMEEVLLNDLKSKICAHDPSGFDDVLKELQKSLLWLRDEIRSLPCTLKCRHDAAADILHIYAHTKCFFRVREYKAVTSPPVYISPQDLGPKYANKLGATVKEYCKAYGENYCLGQLIFWYNQTSAEPDCTLVKLSRGCLSLPDLASFYPKAQKPPSERAYGPRTLKLMLTQMLKQPQRPWPKDRIWSFKSSPKVFGSPMFDSVLNNGPLDREMVQWLKHRRVVFQTMWDR